MPRVPGVPAREAGLLGRLAYRVARYRYGAVPQPAAVMLHNRPAFWAYALWELGNEKALRRVASKPAGAVAVENHRARFNDALGITDQGFTSGEACRVPLRGS